jgi:hypothetical protein
MANEKVAKKETAQAKSTKVSKESRLVKLLSGEKFYTVAEIVKAVGFAKASAGLYVTQSYLDRKGKPYKVVVGATKTKVPTYRYEAKNAKA